MQRARNPENSAAPAFVARRGILPFMILYVEPWGDLGPCRNRILAIFDPYTFSHSQGHARKINSVQFSVSCTPRFLSDLLQCRDLQLSASSCREHMQLVIARRDPIEVLLVRRFVGCHSSTPS
jgi:hypothetical protein